MCLGAAVHRVPLLAQINQQLLIAAVLGEDRIWDELVVEATRVYGLVGGDPKNEDAQDGLTGDETRRPIKRT